MVNGGSITILYEDGSYGTILPGYYEDDIDTPAGFYFDHPDYGVCLAADITSIKLEGGKVLLH